MAKNETRAKNPANNEVSSNINTKTDETKEQRDARRFEEDMDKVKRKEALVVGRKSFDTNDFVSLIRYFDTVIFRLRMSSTPGGKLTSDDVDLYLLESNILKALLDSLNHDMCKKVSWKYNQPRGIDDIVSTIPKDILQNLRVHIREIAAEIKNGFDQKSTAKSTTAQSPKQPKTLQVSVPPTGISDTEQPILAAV